MTGSHVILIMVSSEAFGVHNLNHVCGWVEHLWGQFGLTGHDAEGRCAYAVHAWGEAIDHV